jgi:signal peptidase II
MKKDHRKWCIFTVSVLLLTLLDQLTKILAAAKLKEGPFVIAEGVFELRYLENTGAAFGILKNQQWFFYIITLLFLGAAVYVYAKLGTDTRYRAVRVVMIFLTAGAAGNFIDRVMLHYVRDFFYISLIRFPIFNVADIYVTCAAAGLFILILFFYKDDDLESLFSKNKMR